jgi:hypothetical protein
VPATVVAGKNLSALRFEGRQLPRQFPQYTIRIPDSQVARLLECRERVIDTRQGGFVWCNVEVGDCRANELQIVSKSAQQSRGKTASIPQQDLRRAAYSNSILLSTQLIVSAGLGVWRVKEMGVLRMLTGSVAGSNSNCGTASGF